MSLDLRREVLAGVMETLRWLHDHSPVPFLFWSSRIP